MRQDDDSRQAITPECLIPVRCGLGEAPRWHAGERRLYWVDIAAQRLFRWSMEEDACESRTFGAPVGCFAFRAGGGLVLAMQAGCALIDHWDDEPRPFGPQPLHGRAHHRMNDGRTDASGAFWVGSVNSAKDAADAALYRLSPAGELREIEGGMTTCNGAAFSADGRFFHADTPSHAVRVYDADVAGGRLTNRHILHQFPRGQGRPDGGSVDAEGCYWTALYDGGRVVRLSPAGEIVASIALPVSRPTMIAFGGDDLCTAFITTARNGLDAAQLAREPLAGAVFAFRVAVPGLPEWTFAG